MVIAVVGVVVVPVKAIFFETDVSDKHSGHPQGLAPKIYILPRISLTAKALTLKMMFHNLCRLFRLFFFFFLYYFLPFFPDFLSVFIAILYGGKFGSLCFFARMT